MEKERKILGLRVHEKWFPSINEMLFNFGAIIVFVGAPLSIITSVIFDQFQNADNVLTVHNYMIGLSVGIIFQHFVRAFCNEHDSWLFNINDTNKFKRFIARITMNLKAPSPFYWHWTNTLFMFLGSVLVYFLMADKI